MQSGSVDQIIAVSSGILAYIIAFRLSSARKKEQVAVCVFDQKHSKGVEGYVSLRNNGRNSTIFECHLSGLPEGLHGFHVHSFGDLREGCKSACDHYNPTGQHHGGARGQNRHKGDLGNLTADENGVCKEQIIADVTLDEIVGRMLVVHEDEDDLGKGPHPDSKTTGHSGKRIACGVIGRCPPSLKN